MNPSTYLTTFPFDDIRAYCVKDPYMLKALFSLNSYPPLKIREAGEKVDRRAVSLLASTVGSSEVATESLVGQSSCQLS